MQFTGFAAGIAGTIAAGSLSLAADAGTIHVPGDYPTIQAAINAAVNGDEVVVAPGTYVLSSLISILSKTITLRSSGGPEVTTVQGPGTIFPVFHLTGNSTTIQGFTITGGNIPWTQQFFYGAGISISTGSPTVLDCILTGNVSNNSHGGGAIGGISAHCTVIGCTIIDNVAELGGAIRMSFSPGSATVSDCTFQGNAATISSANDGGAIHIIQGTIENCTFIDNIASRHGGAVYSDGTPAVTGCTFIGNTAAYTGGGLRLGPGAVVTECTFSGNSAASGAGLVMTGGQVTDCTFEANAATGNGGGVQAAGTSPLVNRCTLRGNSAGGTGGGLYVGAGITATLTDTTFCQNTPNELHSNGVLLTSNVVVAINGADCDDAIAVLGACCLPGGGCVATTQSSCLAAAGVYQGEQTACDAASCPAACPLDFNGDGLVGVVDFLALLNQWGTCP